MMHEVIEAESSVFSVNAVGTDFQDIFFYPTIVAVVKTNTGKYFFTSDEKSITRVASYSYKTEGM